MVAARNYDCFLRFLHVTPDKRRAHMISHCGLHWETLDKNVLVTNLLAGWGVWGGQGMPAASPMSDAQALRAGLHGVIIRSPATLDGLVYSVVR